MENNQEWRLSRLAYSVYQIVGAQHRKFFVNGSCEKSSTFTWKIRYIKVMLLIHGMQDTNRRTLKQK